jgi:alkanesulfonate monooxygenase SsuD/methylene tetrahydromethanopterin reductase-like flavin-dependent oxidoreductase (luciferase family)
MRSRFIGSEFQPSDVLKNPYVMIGTQALAADTDEEADFLATTLYMRFLGLLRNQRTALLPPIKDTSRSLVAFRANGCTK